jgi:hypothetical protein
MLNQLCVLYRLSVSFENVSKKIVLYKFSLLFLKAEYFLLAFIQILYYIWAKIDFLFHKNNMLKEAQSELINLICC